jgi:hypothetical protein
VKVMALYEKCNNNTESLQMKVPLNQKFIAVLPLQVSAHAFLLQNFIDNS